MKEAFFTYHWRRIRLEFSPHRHFLLPLLASTLKNASKRFRNTHQMFSSKKMSMLSTILNCVYPRIWFFFWYQVYIVYIIMVTGWHRFYIYIKKLCILQRIGWHDEYYIFVVDIVVAENLCPVEHTPYLTTQSI